MSGNTVELAHAIFQFQEIGMAKHIFAIGGFMLGLLLGAFIFAIEKRRGIVARIPSALVLEVIMITAFILVVRTPTPNVPPPPAPKLLALILLLSGAMGVQNVSVRKIGGINVYTTFVTGSLVKCAEAFSQWTFWVWDRTRHRFRTRIWQVLRVSPRKKDFRQFTITGGLWASYLVGATVGAVLHHVWAARSLIVPLAVLASIAIFSAFRPLVQSNEQWLNE
jgi:uncharacterized membrane protein YoaK (UPF0700 family)